MQRYNCGGGQHNIKHYNRERQCHNLLFSSFRQCRQPVV